MPMTHVSEDFFVFSFVLPCSYTYVAGENLALLPDDLISGQRPGPAWLSDGNPFLLKNKPKSLCTLYRLVFV